MALFWNSRSSLFVSPSHPHISDGAVDPLEHRANLDNVDDDDDDDDDDDGEGEGSKTKGDGVYKPPKLAAVHYDGDETKQEKMEKKAKMRAKAIANASMLKVMLLDIVVD